jgi:hypothetical protein
VRRPGGVVVVVAAALVAACDGGGGGDDGGEPDGGVSFAQCSGSDQAFVRQSYLALLGRRPRSQAEVQVHADVMAAARALAERQAEEDPEAPPLPDPREVVARAILADAGYVDRWSEHLMDALRLARVEDQSFATCYGDARRTADRGIADGALAAHLRDQPPTGGGDGRGRFTMLDVLTSSLHLDDLSVVYRAHLFALVSRPIPAANVPRIEAELARREDFGQVFDSAYLNRDLVCLGCHNSEASITDHPDPALDRHFPVAGHLEKALYGDSTGVEPARAHAMFRFDGFSAATFGNGGGVNPWGIDPQCAELYPDGLPPDPAGIDGRFGALTGDRLTVFDLERSLARGVAALADGGLVIGPDGSVADPDQAFAYLVAMSVVESVWREVMGGSLTIANYFPRNQAAADLLRGLSDELVKNRFSLRELLVDIVTSDYFNRLPPEAGCGEAPYDMPNVFDPWVTSDSDEAKRKNGPADGIVPLSARTASRAAFEALEWPRPGAWAFPREGALGGFCASMFSCDEMAEICEREGNCCNSFAAVCTGAPAIPLEQLFPFQKGIGVFLKNGERGFRGLDFQARLVWEDVFGRCQNLGDGDDFVDRVVARAAATERAILGDVVAVLKDRLVGEARVSHEAGDSGLSELAAVEALLGAPLDTPVAELADLEDRSRALCGVLMSSPQFLMSGMAPPDSAYVPLLTAEEDGYQAVCEALAARGLGDRLVLSCTAGGLELALESPE